MNVTGGCRVSARGFTLIEMLVVVFIIGLIAAVGALNIHVSEKRAIQEEAERLARLIKLAGEEAIIASEDRALAFYEDRYEFQVLDAQGRWVTLEDDRIFRPRPFREQFVFDLEIEGESLTLVKLEEVELDRVDLALDDPSEETEEQEPEPARVLLLSSGEMTPFALIVGHEESRTEYEVTGTITGRVEVKRLGEES